MGGYLGYLFRQVVEWADRLRPSSAWPDLNTAGSRAKIFPEVQQHKDGTLPTKPHPWVKDQPQ